MKTHHLNLTQHDFNEPQCGKDQCDKKSAKAQLCRTIYLNGGHDIQSVEYVQANFHSTRGMKNTKVSVVSIDKNKNSLEAQKIENISKYHSAQFKEYKIVLWN